jgi:hypothetical protein
VSRALWSAPTQRRIHPLARLEYVLALAVCVGLGWVHRGAIDWVAYGVLFVAVDAIGLLPLTLSGRLSRGQPPAPGLLRLYNAAHSAAVLGAVALAWALTLGPEWTLLALPVHLCIDRGVLGNGFFELGGEARLAAGSSAGARS